MRRHPVFISSILVTGKIRITDNDKRYFQIPHFIFTALFFPSVWCHCFFQVLYFPSVIFYLLFMFLCAWWCFLGILVSIILKPFCVWNTPQRNNETGYCWGTIEDPFHACGRHWVEWGGNISEGFKEKITLIAKFMGPTWGPPGADRSQVGTMLVPWSLLSGQGCIWGLLCWD